MSDTPETDKAWDDAWDEGGCYPESIAETSRRLERQRDAYAETLRLIAGSNDRSHHEAAFTALIRERHPELAP